ncbi:MAG: hypothetical protein BWY80_01324 [Firmicutes bacterium ADurb.Bin456]|nr:MAG: hypothetical protein BWY80_01324 [Firmicutes bacterium ADurb.Bin456]
MPQGNGDPFSVGRAGEEFAGFQIMEGPGKNPGVAQGGPSDHNGVTARLTEHGPGIGGVPDITIADYRYADGFLDCGDNLPVGPPAVKLAPGTAMHGDSGCACFCHKPGQLHRVDLFFAPALAHLYGNGNLDPVDHRGYQAGSLCGIPHQSRALVVFDYFGGGAAHIDIDQDGTPAFRNFCRPGHVITVGTKYLHAHRAGFP